MVEVHVAGQVFNPGVYSLPSTARVQDAIEKAGGARPEANLDAINLADWVHDGGKILVPAKGQAAPAGGDTSAGAGDGGAATPSGPVNLNTASEADLDALPGIGPKMAEKILQYRTDHGGFKSVADLQNVPGIGSRKFEAVKGLVTVE
jgi:competence protein ComEA